MAFAVCFLLLCSLLVQNLGLAAATVASGAGAYFFGGKMLE